MTTTAPASIRRQPRVGDLVRADRDEVDHPSRGTWPDWRGRVGTVVAVSRDACPDRVEYGVAFGTVRARADRGGAPASSEAPVWFLPRELAVVERGPDTRRPGPSAVAA